MDALLLILSNPGCAEMSRRDCNTQRLNPAPALVHASGNADTFPSGQVAILRGSIRALAQFLIRGHQSVFPLFGRPNATKFSGTAGCALPPQEASTYSQTRKFALRDLN
jgi:hypothetical protein